MVDLRWRAAVKRKYSGDEDEEQDTPALNRCIDGVLFALWRIGFLEDVPIT